MTAKGAATLGAFLGAAVVGAASAYVASRPPPIEELRKDVAEIKADVKAIKCLLNVDNTCPPSR